MDLNTFAAVFGVPGKGFHAAYRALYDQMTTKPSNAIAALQNTLISTLSGAGILAKGVAMYLQTPSNEQATTLNWLNPTDNTLVKNLSTSYDNTLGFKGNSADSSYMAMDFNPSVDGGGIYTTNAASIFTWMNTETVEDHTFIMGNSGGGSPASPATGLIVRDGTIQGKLNHSDATYGEFNTAGRNGGFWGFVRTDNDTIKGYFNNAPQRTETSQPTGDNSLLNAQFQVFRNANTGLNESDNGFGFLWVGGVLTDAEVLIMFNAVYTYLTAIGATGGVLDPGVLVDIDFEGSTYIDNGYWADIAGTIDRNNTTSPINGSQDCKVTGLATADSRLTFRAGIESTVGVKFKVKFSDATPAANTDFLFLQNRTGGASVASLRLYTTGRILLSSGGKTSYGDTVLSDATIYRIWVDYIKGTGADSECHLYLSTSDTKPGTPECTITAGSATDILQRFRLYCGANLADYQVDDIMVQDGITTDF